MTLSKKTDYLGSSSHKVWGFWESKDLRVAVDAYVPKNPQILKLRSFYDNAKESSQL